MDPRSGLDRYRKFRPPTGIRSLDRSARSQSLYRLCYLAHTFFEPISNFLPHFPVFPSALSCLTTSVIFLLVRW